VACAHARDCAQSDHVHFWHSGGAIDYHTLDPHTGAHTCVTLGPDVAAGEVPQLAVTGDVWKCAVLCDPGVAGHGLVGEAVAPGFDFRCGARA
jgi:uncharacterized protein